MFEDAKAAILQSSQESSVYIGCDSIRKKQNGKWIARFSTVVILHHDSKHGAKLFHETKVMPDYGNIRQRLMTEVGLAVAVAEEIIEVIGNRHLEVHLDLNPSEAHKSNAAVKEALGWVKGQLGIDAKIKPYAWASSYGADHAVKHMQ